MPGARSYSALEAASRILEIFTSCSLIPETHIAITPVKSSVGTHIPHNAILFPSTQPGSHPRAITSTSTSTTTSSPHLFNLAFDQTQPDGIDTPKTILDVFSSFEKAKEGAKTKVKRLNYGPMPQRKYVLKNCLPVPGNLYYHELWHSGIGDRVLLCIRQCVLDRMDELG